MLSFLFILSGALIMNSNSSVQQQLAELLKTINDKLPSGITAIMNKYGRINYQVRTAKTIHGIVNRVTVGTFESAESAVRALIEFKVTGMLVSVNKVMSEHSTEMMRLSASSKEQQDAGALEQAEHNLALLANNVQEQVTQLENRNIDTFKFLESVPFHELDPERSYNYSHPETGKALTIPKDVIAKFFLWMETQQS
jgi:hypothetical protein